MEYYLLLYILPLVRKIGPRVAIVIGTQGYYDAIISFHFVIFRETGYLLRVLPRVYLRF